MWFTKSCGNTHSKGFAEGEGGAGAQGRDWFCGRFKFLPFSLYSTFWQLNGRGGGYRFLVLCRKINKVWLNHSDMLLHFWWRWINFSLRFYYHLPLFSIGSFRNNETSSFIIFFSILFWLFLSMYIFHFFCKVFVINQALTCKITLLLDEQNAPYYNRRRQRVRLRVLQRIIVFVCLAWIQRFVH